MTETGELAAQIAGGAGGTGILAALIYKAVRLLRGDRRKDRVDEAADALRDDLLSQLKVVKDDMKALTERCDVFASERNVAISSAAELRAVVDGLKTRLEDVMLDRKRLQEEMTTLRVRNDDLVQENIRLQASVKTLTEMLTKLTRMPNYDWNNILPSIPGTLIQED